MRSPIVTSLTRRAVELLWTSTPAPKTKSAFKMSAARVRQIHSTGCSEHSSLLSDLRELDTSSLCDAHKATKAGSDPDSSIQIHIMNETIRPMNRLAPQHNNGRVISTTMAGVARAVSFTEPNDFLPVMRALALEAEADEVLVVDTKSSTRAVAGEIFVNEAGRKGLAGIVIDGPIRDTAHLDTSHCCADDGAGESNPSAPAVRIYATGVTPYSGTTQSPGEMQPTVVRCGGVDVRPGDIVVGDNDGVLVGEADAFSKLVPIAQNIQRIESELIAGIASPEGGRSLASMTNLEEHVRNRLEGKSSNLEFRI